MLKNYKMSLYKNLLLSTKLTKKSKKKYNKFNKAKWNKNNDII